MFRKGVSMKKTTQWMVTVLLCLFAAAMAIGAQGEKKPRLAEKVDPEKKRAQEVRIGKRIRLENSANE